MGQDAINSNQSTNPKEKHYNNNIPTSSSPDVEVLGQKFTFPNTNVKLKAFVAFLVSAVFVIYLAMKHGYTVEQSTKGLIFKSGLLDDQINLKNGFILSFWTPSDNSGKYFTKQDSLEYPWQYMDQQYETVNKDFGDKIITELDFSGYRRTLIYGEGKSSGFKEGWWWSVNVTNTKYNEEFLENFKGTYVNFWHPSSNWKDVYVEVIGAE